MVKIDALYFLLLIEILVILLGAMVFLSLKNRKYRGMAHQALQGSPEAKETAPKEPGGEVSPSRKDTDETLRRVIDLQKRMVLNLGQHEDLFEEAFKNLTSAQAESQGLQASTKSLMEAPGKREEVDEAIRQLEKNGQDLETSVKTLRDEKNEFFKVLKSGEDELKRLVEGTDYKETDEQRRYKETIKEKEELMTRISKLEEELKEKNDLVEATRNSYSNLEKEYTILYLRQKEQEEREKKQPPDQSSGGMGNVSEG